MPKTFDKMGIAFQYPDNWTVDEEDALAGGDSVTVESPAGGFWSVTRHDAEVDCEDLASAAVEAMRGEYEEIEAEAVRETVADMEMSGYDLNFYCLDLTNSAQIRCIASVAGTFVVFCQAEDRDFQAIEPVFQAMTLTLLQGLQGRLKT